MFRNKSSIVKCAKAGLVISVINLTGIVNYANGTDLEFRKIINDLKSFKKAKGKVDDINTLYEFGYFSTLVSNIKESYDQMLIKGKATQEIYNSLPMPDNFYIQNIQQLPSKDKSTWAYLITVTDLSVGSCRNLLTVLKSNPDYKDYIYINPPEKIIVKDTVKGNEEFTPRGKCRSWKENTVTYIDSMK